MCVCVYSIYVMYSKDQDSFNSEILSEPLFLSAHHLKTSIFLLMVLLVNNGRELVLFIKRDVERMSLE